ncbi:hemagglutinin [Variovorax sp. J2P1-59]|uniref:M30 family zinc metallopeptidase n=1 Tax=Variovorax flavidus TaxID=3053501 RepID=UPI00257892BD|nr:hemagglutinin [Variovorax sp. J2P1-59]MDM0074525.1 hemagglutinin [Variovorax sp. J2P1-59]
MRCKTQFESLCELTVVVAVALALSACGGGGGGGGSSAALAASPKASTPTGGNAVKASCTDCSAIGDNAYSGSGTGIWQGANASQVPVDIPLSISGLNGQTVTLVLTNESDAEVAMPGLVLRSTTEQSILANKATILAKDGTGTARDAISEFNRSGFAKLLDPSTKPSSNLAKSALPLAVYVPNDQRDVFLYDYSRRTVRLVAQRRTSDGMTVNLWVEASELGSSRVTSELADRMADKFAGAGGAYDMLVQTGGPLWGPHNVSGLLSGSGQPIDIFVVNFDRNSQPYGLVGYFWALNNFVKGSGDLAYSNESLSLYLDSESLYLDGEAGVKEMATAMVHEGMHMQNFYRRGVKMGAAYSFEPWLEEMSAMMMEDWASLSIDPSHNAIRDTRYPNYLRDADSYSCTLTVWKPCESYALTGSFGGFLNRQLGLAFYKALLTSTGISDSANVLDSAIKSQRPDSGIGQELHRFTTASAGIIPLNAGIAEYSMPARNEGGFSLPAIDPLTLGRNNRALPQAVPAKLEKLASFPAIRSNVAGTYSETVRVPPGTTLSVVIN